MPESKSRCLIFICIQLDCKFFRRIACMSSAYARCQAQSQSPQTSSSFSCSVSPSLQCLPVYSITFLHLHTLSSLHMQTWSVIPCPWSLVCTSLASSAKLCPLLKYHRHWVCLRKLRHVGKCTTKKTTSLSFLYTCGLQRRASREGKGRIWCPTRL